MRKLNAFIVMCVLCVLSLRVVVQVPWLPRQQIRIDHEHCSVWEEVPFGRPLIAPLLSNTILWIWKLALKIVQIFFYSNPNGDLLKTIGLMSVQEAALWLLTWLREY